MKIPMEFKPSSLEFLLGLFEGLSYLCFFEMFNGNPSVTQDNLASLEREIAKWFYLCRDNIKNNKELKKVMLHVYPDILSYYYTQNYNALDRAIKLLGQKHSVEKSKGWIGIQYAYILELEALVKQMEKDDKFPEKADLSARFKTDIVPLKTEVLEMNNQVFKAPVPNPEELDFIKPIETKVTPLEPKNIRVPPNEAPNFTPFHSEKVEGLRSNLQLFVSNKKEHVQKSYFDLKEKVRECYTNYNIDLLKTCGGDLKANIMDDEFKNKHRIFREMNGGKKGYIDMNMKLHTSIQKVEQFSNGVDQLIATEDKNDQQLATIAGQNSVTSFRDSNKGEINQFMSKQILISSA